MSEPGPPGPTATADFLAVVGIVGDMKFGGGEPTPNSGKVIAGAVSELQLKHDICELLVWRVRL